VVEYLRVFLHVGFFRCDRQRIGHRPAALQWL